MNKILTYTAFICIAAFAACKKDDAHPFGQSPDVRMEQLLSQYQSTLVNAQYGWRAVIFPDSGKSGGYTFLFKFTNSNRVTMLADLSSATLTQSYESSYRMKGLQQPVLIFDTYSYLHILSDPSSSVNGGTNGKGLMSDFEFAVDTASADSVKLTGRFNGSKAFMVPATKEESENFAASFGTATDFENINNLTTYFKRLILGSDQYDISVNQLSRTVTISWVVNNVVQTFTTGYYYASGKVFLAVPFVNGNTTITAFENVHYDAANSVINLTVNNANGTIEGTGKPLLIDAGAPQRWWQAVASQGSYWYSWTGFTIEGQQDAFGMTTIPNFYFLLFWPQLRSNFDALGFVTVENNGLALNYGIAYDTPPNFTTDGRAIFSPLGTFGTIPPEATTIVMKIATQLADPNGYYFVQTGRTSYDMVSAKDGKAWLSWQY